MLDLLVKSSVRRKVVALFALNPTEELYAAQVARLVQESPYAVGRELAYLLEGGLLERLSKGGRQCFRLREHYPYAPILKSAVATLREQGNKETRSLPDLARQRQIERNIEKVLADLKKYYDPEKVILFGSSASGPIGPYSDIDLVIIKQTHLPYFERVDELVDLLDYDMDIDFLIYTPEEFETACQVRRFVREEILKKGKVLYDKAA